MNHTPGGSTDDVGADPPPASTARRWMWCWRLPLMTIVALVAIDIIAVIGGFHLRLTAPTTFETVVNYLNFPGIFVAFLFGNLLAHHDSPARVWNVVLFFLGGAAAWAMLTIAIGCVIDRICGRCGNAQSGPRREVGD